MKEVSPGTNYLVDRKLERSVLVRRVIIEKTENNLYKQFLNEIAGMNWIEFRKFEEKKNSNEE